MSEEQLDITLIQSKQVLEMITVSNDFCLFMEEIHNFDKVYVISYLQKVLPLLYIKGSLLPETEAFDEYDNERYVIEETWEFLFNSLMQLFGKDNSYYFWNPDLNEPVETTFSENLADMYQDMKDFLFLFSKPSHYAKLNAVYMCRDLYLNRWGKAIPHLMFQIHYILSSKKEQTESYE